MPNNLLGDLGYQDVKPYTLGTPATQLASQALARQDDHDRWHREHPGEYDCPAELSSMNDYEDIERGNKVLLFLAGGGSVCPGDACVYGKEEKK